MPISSAASAGSRTATQCLAASLRRKKKRFSTAAALPAELCWTLPRFLLSSPEHYRPPELVRCQGGDHVACDQSATALADARRLCRACDDISPKPLCPAERESRRCRYRR